MAKHGRKPKRISDIQVYKNKIVITGEFLSFVKAQAKFFRVSPDKFLDQAVWDQIS